MREFAVTFIICLISSYVILFFGGWLIFENLLGILVLVSLVAAVLITSLMGIHEKVDKLEKRIKELEESQKQ